MQKRFKFNLFFVVTLLSALLPSCKSDNNGIQEKAREHFSNVFDIEGKSKVDTVVFLNSSIPQFILVDDKFDKKVDDTMKNLLRRLTILSTFGVNSNNIDEHRDEISDIWNKSFKPLQESIDSLNNISSPKEHLALVIVSTFENRSKTTKSKYIYILGDESSIINDSIIVNKKIRNRVEANTIANMGIDFLKHKKSEVDSLTKANTKTPILKFIID